MLNVSNIAVNEMNMFQWRILFEITIGYPDEIGLNLYAENAGIRIYLGKEEGNNPAS